MASRYLSKRALIVSSVVVAACASLVGATFVSTNSYQPAPPPQRPAPAQYQTSAAWARESAVRNGCVSFVLIEHTVKSHVNTSVLPTHWGVGTMTTYFDDDYDAAGRHIGTTTGIMEIIYRRASDGHLIEYLNEQIKLPGGTIDAGGPVDRNVVKAQRWQGYPAFGISGRYVGMSGTRIWRILSTTNPTYPIKVKMNLCYKAK